VLLFKKPCRTSILEGVPLQQNFFHDSSLSFEVSSITLVYSASFHNQRKVKRKYYEYTIQTNLDVRRKPNMKYETKNNKIIFW